MNFTHKIAENITLKKAGLGFIVDQRNLPLSVEQNQMSDTRQRNSSLKHGRAEAGECKIRR